MTIQPGANLYTQGFGSKPEDVEVPHYDVRAPASTDTRYPVGKKWVYVNNAVYELIGMTTTNGVTSANWQLSVGAAGVVTQITTQDSTVVLPANGNINLSGAGSITTVGSGSTATVELTGLTNHAVLVGAGTTTITKLAVGATGTLLAGSTGADPAFTGSPSVSGSLTAATTITATLGNITATNGNVVLNTAGNKLVIATGTNASVGTSGVMSGTPGAVTVATTASSATAKIFYARATAGGTLGNVSITAQDGTGFTLTSTGNETSTFNWWIINA